MKDKDISLSLDSYDDLFSDFDSRPYAEKALSHDFIQECKNASLDKKYNFELKLSLPKGKRNYETENVIKKRLKGHFQKHANQTREEIKKIKREGLIWFLLGAVVMVGATFLYDLNEFFYRFLLVISEPAGWFLFWEGLDKIFTSAKEKQPDANFHDKMKNASISFNSY